MTEVKKCSDAYTSAGSILKQYGVDMMVSDEGRTQRIPIYGENF